MTRVFAVVGDPVHHSLSPTIHNAAFRELKLDCTYMAYRIKADDLESGIASIRKVGMAGFNVTIPHKVAIMRYLDSLDASCNAIGACNTVSNVNDSLRGYNTDMEGFLDPLRAKKAPLRGSAVLLLGAGGAARAVAAGLAAEGASSVTVANRTLPRAADLAAFIEARGVQARHMGLPVEDLSRYDIIVNATSVGLRGEPIPMALETLDRSSIVYDIVYRPMRTDLILRARERGATIIYGYEMLLGQATRAFEIWHGVKAPYDAMKRALLGGT